jgi:hypothetical protein
VRRLLRHTLNGLKLLLLLLTIPLAAVWAYSYRHSDSLVRWQAGGRYFRITSGFGALRCCTSGGCPFQYSSGGWWWIRVEPDFLWFAPPRFPIYHDARGRMWLPPHIIGQEGWHKLATAAGGPSQPATVRVPYWVLVIALAIPACAPLMLRSIGTWFAARRAGRGFCSKCGYDLRATPGRCPECGTIPAGAKG